MKNILKFTFIKPLLVAVGLTVTILSCKKDSDGSPDVEAGNPTFGSITPGEAAGSSLVTLTGSGLGQIRSIVFDKNNVPATFQANLNTESAILFRVPDTAFGGDQNIIFTNSEGKTLSVPFKVIALPKVTDVSNYDFNADDEITLIGNNFDDVSKVVLSGTTTEATIVSQSRKNITIKMPAAATPTTKLDITNSSGTITTEQEFTFIPNNFIAYTDGWGTGAFNAGVQNWSWGVTVSEATNIVKAGTKSIRTDYTDGGLSLQLGMTWGEPNETFAQWYPDRKYLTFWAYAVDADVNIRIQPDGPWSGPQATMWNTPAGAGGSETVTVPKNTWKYFKIPASTFKGNFSRINFLITGSAGKTVYFDNILWVK